MVMVAKAMHIFRPGGIEFTVIFVDVQCAKCALPATRHIVELLLFLDSLLFFGRQAFFFKLLLTFGLFTLFRFARFVFGVVSVPLLLVSS